MMELNTRRLTLAITLKNLLSRFGIYFAFILIVLALSVITDKFFTLSNMLNVLRQVSINGILAIGMTFVIITGGIDLSVGSVLALAGIISASFAVTTSNPLPLVAVILIGLSVGGLCGGVSGALITRGRVAPFIATLAMMTIARGTGLVFSNGRPVISLTEAYKQIGGGYVLGRLAVPVVIFVFLILLAMFVLNYTRFGRHIYAVGDNENSARASGLRIERIKWAVYIICGAMSGLAGMVLSSRVNAASPIAGVGAELDAIAAVVIGGTSLAGGVGGIGGTVIGALIIGVISNGLDIINVSAYFQQIVKGLIIALAVLIDRK